MDTNTNNITHIFYRLPRNIVRIFSGFNLFWHLLAIVLTYIIVISGFDWAYFKFFRNTFLYTPSFSAAIIGSLIPILLPLVLYLIGLFRKNSVTVNIGLALGQAALLGSIISSFYKAFTGRVPPEIFSNTMTDISREFKFGFLRGGIFWGWPSSHTTIAFAMSVTLLTLFPGNKKIKYASMAYALFIGLSVSISIHWFSEFIAGAIIGTVIGVVVGKSFLERYKLIQKS